MGLFDHLFKTKSTADDARANDLAGESSAAGPRVLTGAAQAPDPGSFLRPKTFAASNSRLAARAIPVAGEKPVVKSPEPSTGEIVLTLGDVLSRIPTQLLNAGFHDAGRELRFNVEDLSADIARGRASVPLSRIASLCPDVFAKQITVEEDFEIRLPLQKLVEQVGLLRPISESVAATAARLVFEKQSAQRQSAGEMPAPEAPAFSSTSNPIESSPRAAETVEQSLRRVPQAGGATSATADRASDRAVEILTAEIIAPPPLRVSPLFLNIPAFRVHVPPPPVVAAIAPSEVPALRSADATGKNRGGDSSQFERPPAEPADVPTVEQRPAENHGSPTRGDGADFDRSQPPFLPPTFAKSTASAGGQIPSEAPSIQRPQLFPPPPIFTFNHAAASQAEALPESARDEAAACAPVAQEVLQTLFMTDETLDLPRIAALTAALPGVEACLIRTPSENAQSGKLPAGVDFAWLLASGSEFAAAVQKAGESCALGASSGATIYGERFSLSFFARGEFSVCAAHSARAFLPGVREKLTAIADALAL